MKKISLVLLLCLCACGVVFGQVSSAKRRLFNEALGMVGKGVPSGWIEHDGSFWKSRDFSIGKEWTTLTVNRNIVEQAQVGCLFANNKARSRWIKESYDTLIADKWEQILGDGDSWVLMKGDKLVSGVTDETDGTPTAAVVFMKRK